MWHEPQLLLSVVSLAQYGLPLSTSHGIWFAPHVDTHCLALHCWMALHGVPADPPPPSPQPVVAPQWFWLVFGSMHCPPQLICGDWQLSWHVAPVPLGGLPPVQTWPEGHLVPQTPQLFGSVPRLTHVGVPLTLQLVSPFWQLRTHPPSWHVWPAWQAVPAFGAQPGTVAPQYVLFVSGSTHWFWQSACVGPHVIWQLPLKQMWPVWHVVPALTPVQLPLAPQNVGLVCGSMHVFRPLMLQMT